LAYFKKIKNSKPQAERFQKKFLINKKQLQRFPKKKNKEPHNNS
jgi:hypothetical protein